MAIVQAIVMVLLIVTVLFLGLDMLTVVVVARVTVRNLNCSYNSSFSFAYSSRRVFKLVLQSVIATGDVVRVSATKIAIVLVIAIVAIPVSG